MNPHAFNLNSPQAVADEEAISREIADPDEAQAAEQQERSTRHSPPSESKVAQRCTAHDRKELTESTTITEKEVAPS